MMPICYAEYPKSDRPSLGKATIVRTGVGRYGISVSTPDLLSSQIFVQPRLPRVMATIKLDRQLGENLLNFKVDLDEHAESEDDSLVIGYDGRLRWSRKTVSTDVKFDVVVLARSGS